MKLRFRAMLRTIRWPAWDNVQDFEISIQNSRVNFRLANKQEEENSFLQFPIEIDMPIKDKEICKTRLNTPLNTPNGRLKFELNPYANEKSLQQAHGIAAYVADVLQDQTHYCVLLNITPVNYIPETEEDQQLVKSSMVQQQLEAVFTFRVGDVDIESVKQSFQRYLRHLEFLHIKAHAMRLNDPISKYRELYRVLEYVDEKIYPQRQSSSQQKKCKQKRKMDQRLANFIASDQEEVSKYTDQLCKLRELRNQCSHARENFITHRDLKGLNDIKEALPVLEKFVNMLEEKLLSQSPNEGNAAK